MGQWINKITGQDQAIDAQQRAAENQATAAKAQAETAAKANQEAARQAGMQQTLMAERQKVEEQARAAADKPPENVDVLLTKPTAEGVTGTARKKRAMFGTGYSSGVQI